MPMLGLGTWENDDPTQCAESVTTALEMGYRHVDTAQIYRNEAAVGEGIAAAAVDRADVFLATKVWIDRLAPADVAASTRESLSKLGVDAVDLLYVHWPADAYDPAETLPAIDGGPREMAGVLPATVERRDRYQALDHVELRARRGALTAGAGERLRGHEFHYSAAEVADDARFAFDVERGTGIDGDHDGLTEYRTLGTYCHVHAASGAFDAFCDGL